MPGGNQPPPEHTQFGPGCTVVHPVAGTKVAAGETAGGAAVGGTIPGGYQPPLAQIQSGPGCTVVHATDDVDDGGGAAGVPTGGVMPGGSQPPLTHVQSGPGRMVVHSADCAQAALLCASTMKTNMVPTNILCKTLTPLVVVKPSEASRLRAGSPGRNSVLRGLSEQRTLVGGQARAEPQLARSLFRV